MTHIGLSSYMDYENQIPVKTKKNDLGNKSSNKKDMKSVANFEGYSNFQNIPLKAKAKVENMDTSVQSND